jgi:hypothetical protein
MYLINVRLTEGAIKNGQSRDTINIGYTRHKTKKPTQYVLDTTMYKTKDEDKKAIVLCLVFLWVVFVLFYLRLLSCTWWYPTHIVLVFLSATS